MFSMVAPNNHRIYPLAVLIGILVVYWVTVSVTGVKPVLLLTDLAVFALILSFAGFVWYATKREQLRDSLHRILTSATGMISLIVLLCYIAVGTLDSIHFRQKLEVSGETPNGEVQYAAESLSVLDVMLTPLRESTERTYSAPFATHSFSKEMIEREDGSRVRDSVRLKHGGAHLQDLSHRGSDIAQRAILGASIGLISVAVLFALVALWLGYIWRCTVLQAVRRAWCDAEIPWRAVIATISLIAVLCGMTCLLATKYHVFGTDKVGGDVLFQSLKSIRTGLVIGSLATLIMLPFALYLGICAGYFKGKVDDVIQYLYTTLNSIPGVLLIAAAVLMLQVYIEIHAADFETEIERADMRLFFLCLILGITSWTGLCRMLRGETLKLSQLDYVQAAAAFGVSHWKIIWKHIQPNLMHIVLISVVLDFSGLVLAEAALSYVGVGVDPTTYSWGNMINSARLEMAREPIVWWSLLAAFFFMFVLVLAANLFSDVVRDAFDPRIRKQ